MTEREALQDIVCKVGVLTYGKERWFKQNGCWYDRMNGDYIQNETLVERVCMELDEEYIDHKTAPWTEVITCPIREENAEYFKWLYEYEPQKLNCRNGKYYSSCEYANKCHPIVCFKALDEFKEKTKG